MVAAFGTFCSVWFAGSVAPEGCYLFEGPVLDPNPLAC